MLILFREYSYSLHHEDEKLIRRDASAPLAVSVLNIGAGLGEVNNLIHHDALSAHGKRGANPPLLSQL